MNLNKQTHPSVSPSELDPSDLASGLLTDPHAGVSIAKISGELLFVNDQAARIFVGDDSNAETVAGRSLWSLFPENLVREWSDFGARVLRSGEPAMVRTIWHGRQVLSWVTPLDAGAPAAEARLLVSSRYSCGMTCCGEDDQSRFAMYETSSVSLGDLDILSPRELEVLALVGQGLSIKEIAAMLHRSEKTIQNHRDSIGAKLGLANRVHVAAVARRAGLTQADAAKKRI
ncbi:MAG: LuxR C-terminal-related transcriptional regulator [Phycisphaerales bacterium]|nr:response regulator transcription factor [Planctomycetota bacterium]MCH8509441.1 LuxR C-terminal-related transcriptional regulator [Phycisphaerales bacterium]